MGGVMSLNAKRRKLLGGAAAVAGTCAAVPPGHHVAAATAPASTLVAVLVLALILAAALASNALAGAREKVIDFEDALVEGVNRMKRHVRKDTTARGAVVGGIETVEAPIHISNVALVADGKQTKVGARRDKVTKNRADGSSYDTTRGVRVARRTGKDV